MVLGLFVSIGHLNLIVKDQLIITMHKPSEGKENVLWAIYLCVCVAVLSYEFLKNQFFLMAIT
jgi:hypothetical protein